MARQEKQLAKLRQSPKNVSPAQLDALLLSFGFRELSQSGSHRKYVHDLYKDVLIIALHKPLDIGAVKSAIRALNTVINAQKEEA